MPSLEVEDTITGLPHEYEMPLSNSLALDLTSSVANGVYQDVETSGNVYELMDSEGGREFYRVYGNTDTPQFKVTPPPMEFTPLAVSTLYVTVLILHYSYTNRITHCSIYRKQMEFMYQLR